MKLANQAGIWVTELDFSKNKGILRCSHKSKEQIITSLTLIKRINGIETIISPVKTSGILRKIYKSNKESQK